MSQASCDLPELTTLMWTNIKESYKEHELEWDLSRKKCFHFQSVMKANIYIGKILHLLVSLDVRSYPKFRKAKSMLLFWMSQQIYFRHSKQVCVSVEVHWPGSHRIVDLVQHSSRCWGLWINTPVSKYRSTTYLWYYLVQVIYLTSQFYHL